MSYEGRVEMLCERGHYCIIDVYDERNPSTKEKSECFEKSCNCLIVWENNVNDTNCYDEGYIGEGSLEQEAEAQYEVCNLGHLHETEPPRYKIPSKEETKKLLER